MANSEPLKRYILIVNKLSTNQNPSLFQIRKFLEDHDINVSERTLQRDIEALRINIGIDIEYDSFERGYVINLNQRFSLDNFMRVARLKLKSELLAAAIDDLQHNQEFISIDGNDKLKGLEYLSSILEAIKNKRVIKFIYTKFGYDESKDHTVEPYHLKEYDGRWYLLAMITKGMTIFSLDRIDELKITTNVFKRNTKIDPKEQYFKQIGVSPGVVNYPVEVKLFFDNNQASYIKTLPWHDTQKIHEKTKSGIVVSYNLIINHELIHQIVSIGEHVKVIAPKSLANDVVDIHRKAAKQYN